MLVTLIKVEYKVVCLTNLVLLYNVHCQTMDIYCINFFKLISFQNKSETNLQKCRYLILLFNLDQSIFEICKSILFNLKNSKSIPSRFRSGKMTNFQLHFSFFLKQSRLVYILWFVDLNWLWLLSLAITFLVWI